MRGRVWSRGLSVFKSAGSRVLTRGFCAVSDEAIVVCMPQLSPSMTSGSISKWLKGPGDPIHIYDVFAEVQTDSLTEPENKVGKFEGTVTMLLESQEDVFLHRTLVPEGKEVKIGTPVAVVCEFEEDLPKLADWQAPVQDVYSEGGDQVRMLTWQSYLKSNKGHKSGGCD